MLFRSEWNENIGKWKINYRGTALWQVKGYEPCQDGACVRLACEIQMDPTVLQTPAWIVTSNSTVKTKQERFTGAGEALYDPVQKALVSISLFYRATLTVPSDKLEEIDWEERPSATQLHGPGLIRIRLTDRLDIRKT